MSFLFYIKPREISPGGVLCCMGGAVSVGSRKKIIGVGNCPYRIDDAENARIEARNGVGNWPETYFCVFLLPKNAPFRTCNLMLEFVKRHSTCFMSHWGTPLKDEVWGQFPRLNAEPPLLLLHVIRFITSDFFTILGCNLQTY